MRVLFVTSEIFPLAKSGGLADVSRALPLALQGQGFDVRVLMPGYSEAIDRLENPRIECWLPPLLGVENAALITGDLPETGLPVWLIYAPHLYNRPGGLYQDRAGRDWADNALRFAYLARVAAHIGGGGLSGWKPAVVHAHDWHAGLVPLYLAMQQQASRPAVVFTLHNLAFQGNFSRELMAQVGIPDRFFHPNGVEFYGSFSFLKSALRFSDKIVTVSPTYGREILTPEFGCGFDGVLRARQTDLSGILNGIDEEIWNPATDPALVQRYGARNISGKRLCKADVQRALGLETMADIPLLGFLSRVTHQKMADILADATSALQEHAVQLAVVGDGDPAIVGEFVRLAARYPGRVSYRPYREALAHRLFGGADILLSPARYEPCGLTQLYALKYGAVPIVRKTGGLADTVVDATPIALLDSSATGFAFRDADHAGLLDAVARALAAHQEPLAWRRLQLSGMNRDFSWRASSRRYALLYRDVSGLPIPSPLPEEADVETARTALSA